MPELFAIFVKCSWQELGVALPYGFLDLTGEANKGMGTFQDKDEVTAYMFCGQLYHTLY